MFGEIKEKFGGLDICVNNAGLGKPCKIIDGTTEDWRLMTDVSSLEKVVHQMYKNISSVI